MHDASQAPQVPQMTPPDRPDRVAEFTAEIQAMKLRGSSAESERWLLVAGVVGIVAGLALTIIGGVQVMNNTAPADQRAYLATGTFLGIALLIAGAALFVRYSLARYLRFWLIRMVWESRANTDRVVAAIREATRD
jgi:predicted metal-binding membrane protein